MIRKPLFSALIAGPALAAMVVGATAPAAAKPVCGWYAVAACTTSHSDAINFASNGWGDVIDTTYYSNLADGYFCVVSGPQTKVGAMRDRNILISKGLSASAYVKRACVDDSNLGGE